jgi:hypothetical protein
MASQGLPIWFDDPSIEPMFPAADWKAVEVDQYQASLSDWFSKYNHHLLVLSFAAGAGSQGVTPFDTNVPPEIRSAFGGGGLAVAIIGTGPWRQVRRLSRGIKQVEIRTYLDALVGNKTPNLSINADGSEGQGKPWNRIRLNNRVCAEGSAGEISVAVIDCDNGILVDCATFRGGEKKTLWSLWKLTPKSRQAAASPSIRHIG